MSPKEFYEHIKACGLSAETMPGYYALCNAVGPRTPEELPGDGETIVFERNHGDERIHLYDCGYYCEGLNLIRYGVDGEFTWDAISRWWPVSALMGVE